MQTNFLNDDTLVNKVADFVKSNDVSTKDLIFLIFRRIKSYHLISLVERSATFVDTKTNKKFIVTIKEIEND